MVRDRAALAVFVLIDVALWALILTLAYVIYTSV
jgi:hypothetical protein